MRLIAAIILFAACASSDRIGQGKIRGGPDQPIAVGIVGMDSPLATLDREGTRMYTAHIEITNMIDAPLTVEKIVVAPSDSRAAFIVQGASKLFNEMIDPGEEKLFLVPVRRILVRKLPAGERHVVEFSIVVVLTNGDSYEYEFEGPVQDIYSAPMPI